MNRPPMSSRSWPGGSNSRPRRWKRGASQCPSATPNTCWPGLYARQAWDLRDYALAATHAAAAAQIALEAKNTSAWWNMSYMQAECLMKQGQLKECQDLVQRLLDHPMAAESAGLGSGPGRCSRPCATARGS